MNETALLKLTVIVERAVRPVKATTYRKRKMREELLAHVIAVFEAELPRCGYETTALTQVEKRFGDPIELARKLQESVHSNDRLGYLFERWAGAGVGESLVQFASRLGILMFAASAIIFLISSLFAFPLFIRAGESIERFVYDVTPICVSMGVMTFFANLLTKELRQSFFSKTGWSLFKHILLAVGYVFVPILIPLVFFVAMSPFFPEKSIFSLWQPISSTLFIALISISTAKMMSEGNRYREEWAELQID